MVAALWGILFAACQVRPTAVRKPREPPRAPGPHLQDEEAVVVQVHPLALEQVGHLRQAGAGGRQGNLRWQPLNHRSALAGP